MLGIILFAILLLLIPAFLHIEAMRAAYKRKGFLGVVNMVLAITIHSIAGIFVE